MELTQIELNNLALEALEEVTEEEMDEVLGAQGVFRTLTRECHMNSWQWIGTCCGGR